VSFLRSQASVVDWWLEYLTTPPRPFTDYHSWGTWEIGTPGFIGIIALAIFLIAIVGYTLHVSGLQLPRSRHVFAVSAFAVLGLAVASSIAWIYTVTGLI
jgi:hypothetical protein